MEVRQGRQELWSQKLLLRNYAPRTGAREEGCPRGQGGRSRIVGVGAYTEGQGTALGRTMHRPRGPNGAGQMGLPVELTSCAQNTCARRASFSQRNKISV